VRGADKTKVDVGIAVGEMRIAAYMKKLSKSLTLKLVNNES